MTKIRKFTDYLEKNKWIFAAFLYVILCVWTFFTAELEIKGVQFDQTSAGTFVLIALHFMLLLAFACAWVLHKIVELFSRFKKK